LPHLTFGTNNARLLVIMFYHISIETNHAIGGLYNKLWRYCIPWQTNSGLAVM